MSKGVTTSDAFWDGLNVENWPPPRSVISLHVSAASPLAEPKKMALTMMSSRLASSLATSGRSSGS